MSVHAPSQRSGRSRPAESPPSNAFLAQAYASQPRPASYDGNSAYVQPGMDLNHFEISDSIMQDLMECIATTAPAAGSLAQSSSHSWSNIGYSSPSVGMEDYSDSLVMVQHAYSQNPGNQMQSNDPNLAQSVGSDEDLNMFPVSDSELAGAWIHGADLMVDDEAVADTHNLNYYLNSLSSARMLSCCCRCKRLDD